MGLISSSTNEIPQKYLDHRSEIQNGDIILYRGSSTLAKLIEYFDNAYYNQIGVVWKVVDPDTNEYRLLTMDMWTNGLVVIPLSERMRGYKDFCIIRPMVKQDIIESAIFNSLKQWEGKVGYDFTLLLRIAIIKKTGIDITGLGKSNKYICSEFIQNYCSSLKISTFDNLSLITPEDFRRYNDPSKFKVLLDNGFPIIFHK